MNTQYKNASFMQIAGTLPAESNPLTWNRPLPLKAAAKPGKIERKISNAMDHFFTILVLISGDEDLDTISVGNIL
jgi:hypothetical protein